MHDKKIKKIKKQHESWFLEVPFVRMLCMRSASLKINHKYSGGSNVMNAPTALKMKMHPKNFKFRPALLFHS